MTARKAAMFDLDGTLAETAPDIVMAFNHGLRHWGYEEVEYEYGRSLVGHGGRDMYTRHFNRIDAKVTENHVDEVMEVFYHHYLDESGRRTQVYYGVTSLLNTLKGAGCGLAVVTNKRSDVTEITLRRLGISNYFDVVVAGNTLPTMKPDPQMLTYAVEQLGASNETSVMVGDTANDVIPAVKLGIPCYTTSLGYAQGDDLVGRGAEMMSDDFGHIAEAIYRRLDICG